MVGRHIRLVQLGVALRLTAECLERLLGIFNEEPARNADLSHAGAIDTARLTPEVDAALQARRPASVRRAVEPSRLSVHHIGTATDVIRIARRPDRNRAVIKILVRVVGKFAIVLHRPDQIRGVVAGDAAGRIAPRIQ